LNVNWKLSFSVSEKFMSAVLERTIVKTMTADEFEVSPFAETHELIRGELYPIMPAGSLHGLIANRISKFLSYFLDENYLGEIFAAETGFKLKNQSTVGADVAFVSRENLEKFGVPDSFFPTAPDLPWKLFRRETRVKKFRQKLKII
jgi:Uma2 family endonuclease